MNSCFHSEAITVDHHATCSFCQISSSLTNHELLTFSRHKFLLKYLDDISVKGFDILSIKADATCAYKNLIKIFAIIKQIVIRTFFLKKMLFWVVSETQGTGRLICRCSWYPSNCCFPWRPCSRTPTRSPSSLVTVMWMLSEACTGWLHLDL